MLYKRRFSIVVLCFGMNPVLRLLVVNALAWACSASGQTTVQDIFGRTLNQRGIALVDWDGYMANPLLTFYIFPPTNAALPGPATLTANGARLYFDTPSNVNADGPGKTISLTAPGVGVPLRLFVFHVLARLHEDDF